MRAAAPLFGLLALLISGCQPPPAERGDREAPAPTAWPGFNYAQASAAGQRVYRLDAAGSRIDVVVRREGPLARFGHDHVVTVSSLEGYLLLDPAGPGSRADLRFHLEDLAIDTPDGRARHQLDTTPDEKAIDGTRKNLMEQVLDARRWPAVTVRLDEFSHQGEHYSAGVQITLNGSRSESRQPFRLVSPGAAVSVEGKLVILQTELGLEPFSALGGGLRVADPLEIYLDLKGARLAGPHSPAAR